MNIILIISDTFRYDNFFDRAAMPVRTPHLDAFSRRAVSATGMWNSSFPTIPHRTDVTTGRYGWPWYPWQSRLTSSRNHLPQVLGQAGYVSQLLCDCPHLFNAGFDRGFHGARVLRGQEGDLPFLRMNHPIESAMPPEKTRTGHHFMDRNLPDLARWTNRLWYREVDRFPPRTAEMTVEWLEENYRHHPFFLWVDFFDPHEPWDPPEYMVRKYDPDYTAAPMIHPNYGHAGDLTPEELRNLRAHYAAEAELVDRWVGRILQKIDDLDLWPNSIVVFTTDHGISLGEHDRTGKSNLNDRDERAWPVYPEIAHLPFLITAPGLEGGREVDALLQPPDILPTLLDLAGVQVETPEPLHGTSFAPMLRGEAQEPLRDVAISSAFIQWKPGQPCAGHLTPAVYTDRWCYVPFGSEGQRELYDLADDPLGEMNVIGDQAQVADDLQARLVGWLKEMAAPAETVAALEVAP